MLKQTQRPTTSNPSESLSPKKWVIQTMQKAVGESAKIRLQVRLRGNNLHLLCETATPTQPDTILPHLIAGIKKSFKLDPHHFSLLNHHFSPPIYQIVVYGKVFTQKKHDWVKTIHINHPNPLKQASTSEVEAIAGAIISYKTLAQSGSTEAIARYLSHQFSYLGVSIKVRREKLPLKQQKEEAQYRLKVICECNYSPEPTLLAEPITQELRKLELHGFTEGLIYAQVLGENEPDWTLKIDLTHPDLMLKEWANWGDGESMIRLLNKELKDKKITIQGELKAKTLHLFCYHASKESPDQKNTVKEITDYLDNISPQGIEAVSIYGIRPIKQKQISIEFNQQKQKPVWIEWYKLPASFSDELKKTPSELAQEDNLDALNFLINRALNHNLDRRLKTGGIRIQLKQKNDLLHILAEAVVCPAQSQVLPLLGKLFRNLTISGVRGIRIYGRRSGQINSLWHENIDFIKRKSSNHELLPEFTNNYYLDISPEFLEDNSPSTEKSNQNNRQLITKLNYLQKLSLKIQYLLAKSGLFITNNTNDFQVSYAIDQKELEAYKGLKVATVWGILGILLTLQLDWVLGRTIPIQIESKKPDLTITKATTETINQNINLPELSLQKSDWKSANSAEKNSFTQMGSTEIIAEVETRDQERSQQSVSEILATYKKKNPQFNNPFLEEKLALYQHRIENEGVADIIIIGSSRAMRGVDPYALQIALKQKGYGNLNIFNFGVNGATVKIVDLILRQLLTPEDLPKIVIFADGARAFNSGRNDTTYQMIEKSEGYQQLLAGIFPPVKENNINNSANSNLIKPSFSQQYQAVDQWLNNNISKLSSAYTHRDEIKTNFRDQFVKFFKFIDLPKIKNKHNSNTKENGQIVTPNGIDYDGFFPLSIKFNPNTYYQDHPLVMGAYDSDYHNFNLEGEQHESLLSLINYLQQNNVQIVFINQPLTDNYLDPIRSKYEQEFNIYLQKISEKYPLVVKNFVNRKSWQKEYNLFSDPSHLNRYGAYQVAQELAIDPLINWGIFKTVNQK